jgi:hypothetical protein
VTDGQAGRQIDVQAALASGARFTVVLVGEGSLEVNVGYLAALTGGQLFICQGGDVASAVSTALDSMRRVASPAGEVEATPRSVSREIAGTRVEANWHPTENFSIKRTGLAAAVAAYAANLAIQGMKQENAAAFAEAEGIVSHLTSIVLVDESAEPVQGIPATRKGRLAEPAVQALMRSAACFSPSAPESASFCVARKRFVDHGVSMSVASPAEYLADSSPIDWDNDPKALASGDLSGQAPSARWKLAAIASLSEVVTLARSLGLDPLVVGVALLAELDAATSRAASRIVRAAFRKAHPRLVEAARKAAAALIA